MIICRVFCSLTAFDEGVRADSIDGSRPIQIFFALNCTRLGETM
jgi:hypothetical protein